jgi:hypothetical protein
VLIAADPAETEDTVGATVTTDGWRLAPDPSGCRHGRRSESGTRVRRAGHPDGDSGSGSKRSSIRQSKRATRSNASSSDGTVLFGRIDEVRGDTHALSESELGALYQDGVDASE